MVLITPRSGVRSPLGVLLHSTALRQNIGESQLFRRWVYSSVVEQPIAARHVTGSNPVGPFRLSVWLNWIEYLTTDQKVPGLNPGRVTKKSKSINQSVGGLFYFQRKPSSLEFLKGNKKANRQRRLDFDFGIRSHSGSR